MRGDLAPGVQLPSTSELIGRYAAANATIHRALSTLKAEGFLRSRVGKGVYVRVRQPFVIDVADYRGFPSVGGTLAAGAAVHARRRTVPEATDETCLSQLEPRPLRRRTCRRILGLWSPISMVLSQVPIEPSQQRGDGGGGLPEPVFLATAVAAATSVIGTVVTAWLRSRISWQQARERARADHVRHLPPGSWLGDLGAAG
jgi:hypothetical protein